MKKLPLKNFLDYVFLTLIVSVAIILILYYNGNKNYQEITIIGLSLLYIVWGILHQKREGHIRAQVILEYVLFALLGSIVVIGLLK